MRDPFFDPLPNPPLHASLAGIAEKELVRRLVDNALDREALLNFRGMPTAPLGQRRRSKNCRQAASSGKKASNSTRVLG